MRGEVDNSQREATNGPLPIVQWWANNDHDHESDSDMVKNAGIVKEWAEWVANTMTMNKK